MSSTAAGQDDSPIWCPEQHIYIGGVVPDTSDIQSLLKDQNGTLRIFGYGSLCWSPGTGALANEGVTKQRGRAIGYQRCWAQKSADHRGTPSFPGIVCTLLSDEEVHNIQAVACDSQPQNSQPSMTEGIVYTIPSEQVEECLVELDFREKGGYARDVIDVVEYQSGNSIKALLYRGTPDNPAFWSRPLLDLSFAAATMAVSIGSSGKNCDYLFQLDEFMQNTAVSHSSVYEDHIGDTRTSQLATMAKEFQQHDLYFLFGSGSNQHNQLLLASKHNKANLVNGEDAHKLTEMLLCTKRVDKDQVKELVAGGGHSGLLTERGNLYLWGWNKHGQLGSSGKEEVDNDNDTVGMIQSLNEILVEHAALGFSHSLLIEKNTGKLFAFGDNSRGQVSGMASTEPVTRPVTPDFIRNEKVVAIAAGLFHSAAISSTGALWTFGCNRFGQALPRDEEGHHFAQFQSDGSVRFCQVVCGRRHSVILDEGGRVWTLGENKHGQLGRSINGAIDGTPRLVEGPLGEKGSRCIAIACGWSHTIATVQTADEKIEFFGWGRNDKGQLGTGSTEFIGTPRKLFTKVHGSKSVCCGSESTMILDQSGVIRGCGWNEHGNLSIGNNRDILEATTIVGARVVAPIPTKGEGSILMAAGGAHFLAVQCTG
jgi:alpha-tubulin suppressor-like RCC1 family protein/cation transport regulator ChaC